MQWQTIELRHGFGILKCQIHLISGTLGGPLPSQAETQSQETAAKADFDKELTDSKKEKVGCGCLKVFYWLVAKCLLGLLNVMDLGQKLGPMI